MHYFLHSLIHTKTTQKSLIIISTLVLSFGVFSKPLVISAKRFTEHQIITNMTTILLQNSGYKVKQRNRMSTPFIRKSLEKGSTDIYWEYTGTAFLAFHKQIANLQTADEIYQTVKELDAENNIVWLRPSEINNTYALALSSNFTPKIATISELADYFNNKNFITFACNFEFCRFDGELGHLEMIYGFKVPRGDVQVMDLTDVYRVLKQGEYNIGLVFRTDAKLYNSNLTVLNDDKNFFTKFVLTPVVRHEILLKYPKLEQKLNTLALTLTNKAMIKLTALVDIHKKSTWKIAKEFLQQHGLIKTKKKKKKK